MLAAATGLSAVAAGVLLAAPLLMAAGMLLAVVAGIVALALSVLSRPARRARAGTQAQATSENDAHLALPAEEPPARVPVAPAVPSAPRGTEPRDALDALVAAVSRTTTVLSAHLWLFDDTTETMRLVESIGEFAPVAEPLPLKGSVLGTAITSGTAALEELPRPDGAPETGTWRYAVPVSSGQSRGCAAVDLADDTPDRAAINRDVAYLRGALAAALALHISRTETAAARALLEAAGAIIRLVDPQAVAEETLERAVAMSEADSGSVMLLDPEAGVMRIAAARGLPAAVVADTVVTEGDGISGWVLATRKPLVVEDLEDRGPRSRRHGIRSAAAVPIADEQGMIGVLNVGSKRFHARFSATHLATLEALGRFLALALRNATALETSRELYLDTVKALALALETKDPFSRGATERVFELAGRLGTELGLTDDEYRALRIAALVHDIGMVAAGDLSSLSDRPLTTVEWGMLKMHPSIAADILQQAPALRSAVPIVYHHHEHFDGTGYVAGLKGEGIPLGARVLAVADAYVSMTSPRAYRTAFTVEEALAELADKSGSQFDPDVVGALRRLIAEEVARPAG
jgi:hypothetical protein